MTSKEYLLQVKKLDRHIDHLNDRRKELNYAMLSVGSVGFGPKIGYRPGGQTKKTRFEKLLPALDKVTSDLIETQTAAIQIRFEIYQLVAKLDSNKMKVIYYRYLQNMSWEDVARKLEMPTRTVYKTHQRALEDLNEMLKGETA